MRKVLVLVVLLVVLFSESVLAQNNFPVGYEEIKVSQPGMVPLFSRITIQEWLGNALVAKTVTVDAYIQWINPSRPDLYYSLRGDDGTWLIWTRPSIEGVSLQSNKPI